MISHIKKFFNTNISFLIILIIVVFCIYGKSVNYELLLLDDKSLIENKINFVLDVKNLPKIFVLDCFYNNEATYYRPVLTLSIVLESLIFGYNTKVYHITNIFLFILNIYLIYLLFLKLQFNKNTVRLVCILLAVYPVLTSCCVWIAARNDTLLSIFTMLIFLNLTEYIKFNKNKNLILTALFFLVSLLTKETGLVFIVVCPLFIYLFEYRISKKTLYSLVSALSFSFFIYLFLRMISVRNISFTSYLNDFPFILKNIFVGFVIYIDKLLWPFNVPIALYNQLCNIYEITVFIFFILILFFIYKKTFNKKIFVFGLLMFVLYLLPTFAIGTNQLLFHRLLIPIAGLLIILINIICELSDKYKIQKKYFVFLWFIIFFSFSINSYLQADKYENNDNFIINGYINAPKYYPFINGMAKIHIKYENYDKAMEYLSVLEGNELNKNLVDVAVVLCGQNKFEEAEEILNKSIELNYNVELCYANLSIIYEKKGEYAKALEYALKSYAINSYNIDISLNLARMYRLNNQFKEAIDIYNKLLKFNKINPEYYYSLGVLYNDIKDKAKAMEFLEIACKLDPKNEICLQKLEEIKNIED